MDQTWWNEHLSKPENMDIFKKWIDLFGLI